MIAGPNVAGKTPFATRFLPGYVDCTEFLNADLIATGLAPFAPETQNLRAFELMLERMAELVSHSRTFAFETTLPVHFERAPMIRQTPPDRSATEKARAAFCDIAASVVARARQTHTPIIVSADDKILSLTPDEYEQQIAKSEQDRANGQRWGTSHGRGQSGP